MKKKIYIIFILAIVIMVGCSEKPKTEFKIEKINKKMIDNLKHKKIFFGHQSVGYNIIEAIENLKTGIQIQELGENMHIGSNGIFHANLGKNGFPATKVDAFIYKLRENDLGTTLDAAFLKLCYVDFNADSEVTTIFRHYIETVRSIRKEFPNLKIVHVTVPLTVHSYGIKDFLKNLIRGDLSNIKRNQYNTLLINEYTGKEPIYDLAKIESSHPDGKRESFNYHNNVYYALAKEYTNDGGHLNNYGSHLAAKALLKTLSEVLHE